MFTLQFSFSALIWAFVTLPSAAHIKKEKKKSKETLGETQAGGDFSISPAAKGAVLDTSKWPLLLKVRLYTQLPHSPHTSLSISADHLRAPQTSFDPFFLTFFGHWHVWQI
jgi:hypothetical protein